MPPQRAIHPAWRPITSSTITRLWLSAGGVEAVERIDHGGDGAVEAEGEGGGAEVVVDGFRHADDRPAFPIELQAGGERAVAADDDEGADFQLARMVALALATISGGTSAMSPLPTLAAKWPLLVVPRMVPPSLRMPMVSFGLRMV